MLSSWVCWRLSATCAAITRCLSAISVHWAQLQSRHLQYLLCPFSHDTIPWIRQRAHFGMRGGFLSDKDCWITKEVSAMSRPRTLENLLKSMSCCRDEHSTLSAIPLDATRSDWRLSFVRVIFFTFKKFKSFCLRAPWLVQGENSFYVSCQLFLSRVNNSGHSTYTRQPN